MPAHREREGLEGPGARQRDIFPEDRTGDGYPKSCGRDYDIFDFKKFHFLRL